MKVCLAGSFDPGFSRNRQIRRLLEISSHDVVVSHIDIWDKDRVAMVTRGAWRAALRAIVRYPLLVWRLLVMKKPDVVFVGYPGWLDVPFVAMVCRLRQIPLAFDIFISLFDTTVSDRALLPAQSLKARTMKAIDRWACRAADRVLVDTSAHGDFIASLTATDRSKFGVIALGAREDIFHPVDVDVIPNRVGFHGSFVPLQGIDTIVRAAQLLDDRGLKFHLIGDGQEAARVDRLISDLGVANIVRRGLVPVEQIPNEIAASAIMLGIFGTSDKAGRVVPNKVYESLAVGRPVITGATQAVAQAFDDSEIVTVAPGDPEALAEAIRGLVEDDEQTQLVARRGHDAFTTRFSERQLAIALNKELELLSKG
jgi:glycosyltransferase involved in cell wall biosynthesis